MKKLSLGGSAMASPQQQPRSPPERLTPPPLLLAGRNRSHPALLPPRQRSEAMSFVPAPSVQSTPPQGAAAFSREMMHKWQSARELAPLEETLVEAFEAQGLLSLCGDLLERLPSRAILQSWDAWLPTFNRYLGHSASTVRQACSSLFLRLMAKTDEGAGVMQRAVLLGLSFSPQEGPLQERYSPTVDHAHAPTSPDAGERGGEKRAPHHESPSAPPLLSGAPFGSASSPLLSAAFGSSPGLHETPGGAGKQGGGHWAGQTWEWREGRLLAYELVLGHLVRDHATHMFRGDVVLPPDGTPPRPFASLKVSPMQGVDDGRKGSMKNVAVSPGGGHTLASSSSSASTASNPSGSARSGGPSPGARVPSPGTRLLYFGQADAGGADAEASGAGVAAAAAGGGGEAGEVERLKRSDGGRSAGGSSGGSGKGVGLSSGVRRRGAGLLLPVQVAEDCSLLDRFRAHDGQPDDSCFPGTCSPMRSGELRGGGGVGGEAGGSEPGDEEVRGEPLGGALERMLDEVLHCIGDIRWELRRMGLQVLPLLCVTTLWYEKALLEDIWLRWLPHEAGAGRAEPPYSYVAALALKEVLKKILELSDVLQSGAAASIPPESAARVREAYVWIETLVPRLLPAIEVLLALRHPLRVGALGVELMMLIHTRLPGAAAARQREEVVLTERWIRAIYTAAHAPAALPEGAHADASAGTLLGRSASDRLGNTSPISSTEYAQEAAATPPSAGRLAGGRSSQRAAENIERALLKVVAPLIPDFVASCDVHQMLALVKVLVPYLESYHEEFEIELQVVEALQRILQLPIEIWGPELLEKSSTSQNSSTSPMGSNGPNGSNAANGSSVQTRRHSGEGSDPHTDSDAIADAPPPSQVASPP
ncbi:hypothetical protein T484DRAFT_3318028 [Baffinella frigidus]|nr:hypothetical protein T484DRAFT_3318028 [Cryptophyta sp. CCMP2293]